MAEKDMMLPETLTCDDCIHFARCTGLIGEITGNTNCDWSPSMFIFNYREIIEHRRKMEGAHPERYCQRCNHRMRLNYSAASEIWNRVMRDESGKDQWGIICIDCFIELCQGAGVEPVFVACHIPGSEFHFDLLEIGAQMEWLMKEGNYCKLNENTASPNHGKWYAGNEKGILSTFHDGPCEAIGIAMKGEAEEIPQ